MWLISISVGLIAEKRKILKRNIETTYRQIRWNVL